MPCDPGREGGHAVEAVEVADEDQLLVGAVVEIFSAASEFTETALSANPRLFRSNLLCCHT